MHLKINTETFTFAIVQQGVRLVFLPSHPYEIKDLLPDLMGQNLLTPESIALQALTEEFSWNLMNFHPSASSKFHQYWEKISDFTLWTPIRKCINYFIYFILTYFIYFSLDFNDECLNLSRALAKSRSENILRLCHGWCSGRLWSPSFCTEQLLLNFEWQIINTG